MINSKFYKKYRDVQVIESKRIYLWDFLRKNYDLKNPRLVRVPFSFLIDALRQKKLIMINLFSFKKINNKYVLEKTSIKFFIKVNRSSKIGRIIFWALFINFLTTFNILIIPTVL